MRNSLKRVFSAVLAFIMVAMIVLPSMELPTQALTYSGSSSYKSGKYYTQLTNVKLTGDQRKDIVAVAKSQVGY